MDINIMDILEGMANSAEVARRVKQETREAQKITEEQEKIEKQRRIKERQEKDKNKSLEELKKEADEVAETFISQMVLEIDRDRILDVRNSGPDNIYKKEEVPAHLVDPELFIPAAERFIDKQNGLPGKFILTAIGESRGENFRLRIEKRTEKGGEIK